MKKLKQDSIDYSKIYSKFVVIPFLSIMFVIAYCSLPFIKMLSFDGQPTSAIGLFKQTEWIFGFYFIFPPVAILVSFVVGLIKSIKNKAFYALDLSANVCELFSALALYSIIFMALTRTIDGATEYVQWMILMPIIYIAINAVVNFICCLLSGKAKLSITVVVYHCICLALLIVLAVVIVSAPLVQLGDEFYGVLANGKLILFNETFISVYGESEELILIWAITGLVAVILTNIIEKVSDMITMYKTALMYKNDYFLELALKDDHSDWKGYLQTQEGKLAVESSVLESNREELGLKNGVVLAIVGLAMLIVRMGVLDNIAGGVLQVYTSMLKDVQSSVCWAAFLIGLVLVAITIVAKRIAYNRLVKIEELTSKEENNTVEQSEEK